MISKLFRGRQRETSGRDTKDRTYHTEEKFEDKMPKEKKRDKEKERETKRKRDTTKEREKKKVKERHKDKVDKDKVGESQRQKEAFMCYFF